jgi:hypothetical protein
VFYRPSSAGHQGYSACRAADTDLATAASGAIRLTLLRISAIVRFSVRRIGR